MNLVIHKAEDGSWMQVARPDAPKRAMALARQAYAFRQTDLLDALPQAAGCPYTYLGYLAFDVDTPEADCVRRRRGG